MFIAKGLRFSWMNKMHIGMIWRVSSKGDINRFTCRDPVQNIISIHAIAHSTGRPA